MPFLDVSAYVAEALHDGRGGVCRVSRDYAVCMEEGCRDLPVGSVHLGYPK